MLGSLKKTEKHEGNYVEGGHSAAKDINQLLTLEKPFFVLLRSLLLAQH